MPIVQLPDGRRVSFPDSMSHAEIEAIIANNRQPDIAPAKETRSLPPSTPTEIVTTPEPIGVGAGRIATVKPQAVEGGTAFAQTRDEFITGSEDPGNLKRYEYKLAMEQARKDGENVYPAWLAPAMAISYGAYQGTTLPHRLLSSGLDMAGVKLGTDWQKYYAQQDKYYAEQIKEAGGEIGTEFLGGLSRAAFEMPLTLLAAEAAAATKTMQLLNGAAAGGGINLGSTVAQKAITDARVTGSAAMSGIQSALGKYAGRREDGAGRFEAGVSGATSGLITGIVTKGFGATGLEAIYAKGGKKGLVEAIKKARIAGKYESAEELTDEGIQDFVDRLTFDPNRPFNQTLKQMAMAYGIGGTLGSGMSLTHSGMAANEEKKARQAAKDEHDASVDLKIADLKKNAKSSEELQELAEIEIAVRKQRANRDALPPGSEGNYYNENGQTPKTESPPDPSANIETGTAVTPVPTEAISPESPLPVAPSVPLAVETTPLPTPLMEPSTPAETEATAQKMGGLTHAETVLDSELGTRKIEVKDGDTVVGYIAFGNDLNDYDTINMVWVKPDYRGKGISTELYRKALASAKERGRKGLASVDANLHTPEKTKSTRKNFIVRESTDRADTKRALELSGKAHDSVHFIEGEQASRATPAATGALELPPAPSGIEIPRVNTTPDAKQAPRVVGDMIYGKPTKVKGANDIWLEAVYAWAPLASLEASHKGESFAENKIFAGALDAKVKNTKDYQESEQQIKVYKGQNGFVAEEYVAFSPSAAVGPMMVSEGTDGVRRVLGGNGRYQIIARLSLDQQAEFGRLQDEYASMFGLPSRPTDGHVLVRVLPAHSVNSVEGIAATNFTIDILNPSDGLVEDAVAMAVNDSAKVSAEDLSRVRVDGSAKEHRAWISELIGKNVLDRNTRTAVMKTDAGLKLYAQYMIVTAAYQQPTIADLHATTSSATTRGTIELAVPMLVAMRGKGEHGIADGFSALIQRIGEAGESDPSLNFKSVLETVYGQEEINAPPEFKLAQGLAGVLSLEVEESTSKSGATSLNSVATLRKFKQVFSDFEATVSHFDPAPDMFGEKQTMALVAAKFIHARLGDGTLREGGKNKSPGDPKVLRLRKLREEQSKRTLTQREADEIILIEAALGQSFMFLFNEVEDRQAKANEQSKRLAEAKALTKDTIGDLTLQGETLFPQQGTLFASDKGRSKGTNEFPGFDTGPTKDIPNEPGPTKKIIGPAQQQRDRVVQLGWFSEPQEPERSRGGTTGNAKQLVKARAEHAPEGKPRDRLEELAPELKKILRPHQVDEVNLALEAFANGRNFGLFSGTGAGKTVTELTTAYLMSKQTGKPSIIVTAGDGIIGDAFARDAEMLGIDLFRYKGSALAAGQNVLIATYNDVSSGSIVAGQFVTVIFDESHHLRNQGQSLRPHIGNLFAASAEHVMFASGTPLDRPQGLWYLRSLLSESPEKALLRIGIETKQRWDSDGNPITFFESIEGVGQKEIESGLESLFDGVYKAGLGIKHEVPLDNLDVVLTRVELTPEEYKSVQDVMGAAELKYEDAPSYVRAGLIMMAGRSALEAQKGRHAMESVEKALAEGKQVIVYAHRIEGGGWGLPNGLAAMEAKMRAKYGDAVGSIYGGASTAASAAKTQKTVDGFQNGKIKILFSTPQSGGTGISLDDIRGDAPRHLILVTSPFSALDLIQIAGRINRLNTASRATMEILLANHRVDNWNLGISLSKLGTLQATVKGDIGEMVLNEGTKKPSTKPDYEQLELNALFAIEHLGLGAEYNNLGSAREIAREIRGTQPVPTADKVGPARVVEKRIAQEMLANGFVRIDGQIVKNARDIGVLLNLWRSPQFEVSAIHAIKNGVIVGSRVMTANLPNTASLLLPGENIWTVVQWLNSLGADTTVFSHNHPSGNSSPSDQDIATTESFAHHLKKNWNGRFWGHVVTDHGRFHVIDGDGASRALNPSFGGKPKFHQTEVSASPDPLISKAGKLTQQKITGFFNEIDAGMIQKVGNQVKGVQEGETIALMFLDQSESTIRAVYEVSVGDFPSLTPEHLREIARGQGASIVVAVMTKLDAQKSRILGPQIVNLIRSGALYDFVADKTEMRTIAIPIKNDDLSETKDWMGVSQKGLLLLSAGKPKSKPIIIFGNVEGRKSEMPYNLGGLDHVRVVDMPELVKLAKRFLGHLPKIKKLGGPAGVFRHKGDNFTIEIDPRVFRDPIAAAKVLAHEFGHLTDYLPDLTLDRGNILGRLGGLRGWLATTIPLRNTGSLNSLTPTDRKILRRQAEQDTGPKPAPGAALTAWQHEVSRRFAELKKKEIKARGLVERDEIAAELRNLTMLWHPYDEATSSDSYKKYRNSSVELYADFLSALFNSPGFAADTAPLAYKMFWDYLDSKPEMKVALFSLQDFLSSGRLPVLEQRSADIQEMFGKGEDIMARKAAEREARRTSTKGWLLTVKQEIIDAAAPVIGKIQQAEKAGKKTDPTADPRRFIEEQLMMDNVNARMLDLLHRGVMQPIEAADITMGLLGEYVLFQRILHGDRGNIADPLGHDVKSAREGLLRIRLELGPDRMDVMLRAVAKFHEIVWGVVEEGVRVGSYNRETFDTVLVPNKGYYVAFGVLDYLQDYVPAGVKKQTGTFKEIANPFTQTVLKMIALNNLNSVQRTKNSFVDFMAANFSTEMMPAETYFDGANHRPVTHPDWGIFERLENGKRKWYYVDPLIADAFENDPPLRLQQVLRVLETGFQKVFYPLWITYNTAFQIANIKRDWSRTRRNTGLGFVELGKYYFKGFSAAVARQRAIGNPIITEMTENYAIGPADINFTDLEAREDFIGKKMQRYGLLPEVVDSKLKSKLLAGVDWVRFIGNVIETMPKVAAYAALRARGVSPVEVSMTVRNFVGTPNTYKRGKRTYLIRPFVPFFNVFAQGFRADASLAFSPKTAGGWWWRWASTDGLWAVMTALAAGGLLGDELKKWLAGISENDKANYNLIPVGVEAGGDYGYKTVYIRVPRDESSRLLSAMLYKTVRLSIDGKVRGLSDIAAVGLDQLPAINPVIEIAGMVALAAAGHHVREFPSGRPIMSRDEFDAGGIHKVEAMAVWTYNQTGLQDLARLTDLKGKEGWNATMQFVPGIHRFIKVSDQGHREAQWEADRAEGKVRALHKMAYSPEVLSLYSEYYLLRDLGVKGRTQAQGARYDVVKGWHKNVFSVHDEAIHQFKDIGDNGTADNIRNILRENSKLYLKK